MPLNPLAIEYMRKQTYPGSAVTIEQTLAPGGVSGSAEQNTQFLASISANTYVSDLSGPLQLHHGMADQEVPLKFSQALYDKVNAAGKSVEFYTYPGDDHNISTSFNLAMQRSIAFFNKYVKGD